MKIFGGSNKTENNRSKLMGCCEGKVAELKETDDDIISSGILGEGYAVYPKMNEFTQKSSELAVDLKNPDSVNVIEISSPVSGRVLDISSKPEAVLLKTDDNLKVLISFTSFSPKAVYISVRCGDLISTGDRIADVKVDRSGNRAVYVVIENSDILSGFRIFKGETAHDKAAAEYTL